MKLTGKTILLVSPEPWDHVFVSKHHYAVHLAKRGNRVFFLNPPSDKFNSQTSGTEGLTILNSPGFVPGLRYMPAFLRRAFTRKTWKSLERFCGCSFDVLWSFDMSVFFQIDALPESVFKICHVVDLNQEYEWKTASNSANLVIGNSTPIINRFDGAGIRAQFIHHGFVPSSSIQEMTFPASEKLRVGYAGNLDIQYLDWNLIKNTVSNHTEIEFVFAGSCTQSAIKHFMKNTPNVTWIGQLNSYQLPSFYHQMNVLIICYKADEFTDQLANPHKVMEYLYSGKPIVATYTAEYASSGLLYMSKHNHEWPALFADVISNLDKLSAPELEKKRREFAMENTYEKQIERIEGLIETSK